jgi:hypothetical protein
MEELPQIEGQHQGHKHKHQGQGEQWGHASACGSGDHKPPRAEDELADMRAKWKAVLQEQGKLVPSAVRPIDVAPRPEE